jgi:hypothetical protein
MRKIIDDKGRLFGLISFIDVIVIVVVILLAVAVLLRTNTTGNSVMAPGTVGVTYTARVPSVRLSTVEQILPGDKLYTDMGTFIGTITEVEYEDAYSQEPLADGTIVMGRVHERYDAILTVEAQCSFSDGSYYANKIFELKANSEHRLQTKYNIFTAVIVLIKD